MSEDTNIIDENKYRLHTNWNLYFHHIKDIDWSFESYKHLYSFDSVCNFWRLYNNFPQHSLGMFFLMRDGINPLWEDPHNMNGGTFSFKIGKNQIKDAWLELSMAIIGESIFDQSEIITGISLHPKYNCYIIKIWVSENITKLEFDINLTFFDPSVCFYKKNIK